MRSTSKLAALLLTGWVGLAGAEARAADAARFDLTGPVIQVRVTRGTATLPIAEVPNLQAGDKLWVKAALPEDQRNHLILVVAFLRGTTNEPPDDWFTEIDTWDRKKTQEGTTITVPANAQQALLFVAPETGGDFKTLRGAVKGRPGLFIRADADLNEASFEQQRIERYLAGMKMVAQADSKTIQDRSAKLAATLGLKPNADCVKQPVDQQVTCLTQTSAPQLLSDGHSATVAEALSTGASSDFINQASYTQAAGYGTYSAYVGAVVDAVHLISTLRTAQFQYIPGLAFPKDDQLNVKLNAPFSTINPKTVIVMGLPAIQKPAPPPLKAHAANDVACLLNPKMALLLDGAPLVFATNFAHDLELHLNRSGGGENDLPLKADPFEGGLVVSKGDARKPLTDPSAKAEPGDAKGGSATDLTITGVVRGRWGFDEYDGPTVTVQQIAGKGFQIVGQAQPMAGQDAHLSLTGQGTGCVNKIALTPQGGGDAKPVEVSFKPAEGAKDDKLELTVSLKDQKPGGYALSVAQFGAPDTKVEMTAFSGDIKLNGLKLHAGDNTAQLQGQGLDQVAQVELNGAVWKPVDAPGVNGLMLKTDKGATPKPGEKAKAKLKDGRTMEVSVDVQAARPTLTLVSSDASPSQTQGTLPVTLGGKNDIPLDGKLTFVVSTKDAFPRDGSVEVATADGGVHTSLSVAKNSLILQDEHTAVATLEPLKAFGASAFGVLQMRPVAVDGTPGDWTQLGTLVRTPRLTAIQCTTADAPTCKAEGSELFLVEAFGAAKDMAKAATVPSGYAQGSFAVPTPADGTTEFLKLRDDPSAVASVTLPTPVAKGDGSVSGAAPVPAAGSASGSTANSSAPASGGGSEATGEGAAQPASAGSPGAATVAPAPVTAGSQPATISTPAASSTPHL